MAAIIFGMSVMIPQAMWGEASPTQACEYFAEGTFQADNGREYQSQRNYEFSASVTLGLRLERYQTIGWQDVSVAMFKMATDPQPNTFLSARMVCLVDVIDRRVLELSIFPGERIGERVDLPDGDYQFMIEPKSIRTIIGDKIHEGKY